MRPATPVSRRRVDRIVVVTQLFEHLGRVLAESWRRATGVAVRVRRSRPGWPASTGRPTRPATSTIAPDAWNCSSPSRSSMVFTGVQNRSGSASNTSAHSSRVRVANRASSSAISSRAFFARARGVAKRGSLEPLRPPDRSGQGRPVALAFEADDPEVQAVAGGVVVHRRVGHRLADADLDGATPEQRDVDVEADRVGALAQQRGRHELALPGPLPLEQRRADHGRAGHGHGVVTHAGPLERQRAVRASAATRPCPSGPRRRRCRRRRGRRRRPRGRSR